MKKAFRILGIAGLAVGVLAYPAAFVVDRISGVDVIIVAAADPAGVTVNRGMWELNGSEKAEIPSIYGTPSKGTDRIVFAAEANLLHPKEDPSLTLFIKRDGVKEIQAMTLYFFAVFATIGGIVTGGLLLWLSCRKKAAPTS